MDQVETIKAVVFEKYLFPKTGATKMYRKV